MPLLSLKDVSLAYGHYPLLDKASFQIDVGERVCLVGRNGTGKSSLFRLISGQAEADDGEIWRKDTLRISYLEQEVPLDAAQTIYETVADGLGELGQLLTAYHSALAHTGTHGDANLDEISRLQQVIEAQDGWNVDQKITTILTRLQLPPDVALAACSGGTRRRVMLAKALVGEPDLLLLDEPTNHMDIVAITWLEEFLLGFKGALMFITHDRTFLRHLATRIVELDRGKLTSFACDFDGYLQKKEELLAAEARANEKFDKELAEHEVWIRQGIKARRTRNEGRVTKLIAMRKERSGRIERAGNVNLEVDSGEESGKRVVELRHVSFAYHDKPIIRDFSLRIMRGDRIGIIGPNGSGKSTLLNLILGNFKPDQGQVLFGTRLQTAFFDQQREQLDLEKTVRNNIGEGRDYIEVNGRSKHIISYLRDFLFPAERVDAPVGVLSGGERNRLLLAKMFTRPANLMILDEPTNDLDVDTLELLEDLLASYAGTLILVSHDRAFVDNVVTSTVVFEGDGRLQEYVGGYEDYLRQRQTTPIQEKKSAPNTRAPERQTITKPQTAAKKKLSYKEQRELEALPRRIEALESEQQRLEAEIALPAFYAQNKEKITTMLARVEQTRKELEEAFDRWEYLDSVER